MTLYLNIQPHQVEDHVQRVLQVDFQPAHHLIVARGEEVRKAGHEGLGMPTTDVFDKVDNGKPPKVLSLGGETQGRVPVSFVSGHFRPVKAYNNHIFSNL